MQDWKREIGRVGKIELTANHKDTSKGTIMNLLDFWEKYGTEDEYIVCGLHFDAPLSFSMTTLYFS